LLKYQSAQGIPLYELIEMHEGMPIPDIVFLFLEIKKHLDNFCFPEKPCHSDQPNLLLTKMVMLFVKRPILLYKYLKNKKDECLKWSASLNSGLNYFFPPKK
jgi:hypothetical protein